MPGTNAIDLKYLPIQDPEELHDTLLSPALSRGWLLHNEWVYTSVVTSDGQPATAVHGTAQQFHFGLKTINPHKVIAIVLQQQILARDLHIVKLLMLELCQVMTPVLELLLPGFAVKNVLKLVAPSL